MVGFKVGCIWYEIGAASFLHSFFSTVAYNLEGGNWGTRFPVIMNELYQGKLTNAKFITIDHSGHEVNMDNPEGLAKAIEMYGDIYGK